MNCARLQTILSDHLDGRLPAALSEEAEAHLRSCPRCRARSAGLSEALAALREEGGETLPPGFTEETLFRIHRAERPRPASAWDRTSGPAAGAAGRPGAGRDKRLLAGGGVAAAALLLVAFFLGREAGRRNAGREIAEGAAARIKEEAREDARRLEEERRATGRLEKELASAREELAEARRGLEGRLAGSRRSAEKLQGEVQTLRTAVADLEEERVSLRRELDDLRTRAEAARAAPARVVRAAPRPAPAVAFERQAGERRSMAIDLSGPDSRVIPALLVLAEGEDDDLGEAALELLRERLGPLLDDPPADEGRARPRGPGPAVLASLGTLLGPLGRSLDPGATPAAALEGSAARLEAARRIREAWETFRPPGEAGAAPEKL